MPWLFGLYVMPTMNSYAESQQDDVVAFLHTRRIKRVPLALALKAQE